MDLQDRAFDAARGRLDAALQSTTRSAPLLLMAAQSYAALRDAAAAERLAREALAVDANSLEAYSLLGNLYITQGRIDDAIVEFSIAAQKDPSPVAALTIVGVLLEMQNKPVEAREKYERALDLDPRAAVAANNLASIYTESGASLEVALDLAKTARARLPNRPEVNHTLGWVYFKKGEHSMAVTPLLAAIDKNPTNPRYHYHLGLVYAAMGDRGKARASLQKSLALDAEFRDSGAARQALADLES
jgi:tetratricopeptide (TPR) repeat protein